MPHKTARSVDITSPVIRGAYFYIHEKRTKDGQKNLIPEDKQRYEFVGLIPKTNADPAQCGNYRQFADLAMSAVSQVSEWGGQLPAGGNWPISDGDDVAKLAKSPWRKGCWVIKFSANFPPKVAVLQNQQAVEIPARRIGASDLYKSGDYCIVSTYAFTYDDKAKGVKFDIQGVLFVGAGEPIGTVQRSVTQMFANTAGIAVPQASSLPTPPVAASTYAPPAAPATYAPTAPAATYAPPVPAAPAAPQPPQYAPPAPAYAPPAPVAPPTYAAPPLAPAAPPAPGMVPLPAFPAPR
jgi:hypothetical protein